MSKAICLVCKFQDFESRSWEAKHKYVKTFHLKNAERVKQTIAKISMRRVHACSQQHSQIANDLRKIAKAKNYALLTNKEIALEVAEKDLAKQELLLASARIQDPDNIEKIHRLEIRVNNKQTLVAQRKRRLNEIKNPVLG